MKKETISIIVPAYNCAPWLPRCLDSILAQTHGELEVLVVDDGSTDETPGVVDAYERRDSRIKAIHKENGGVTTARLKGVAEATGSWIGFVDGDDEIEPEMYERLLKNAGESGADISHCGFQTISPDGAVSYLYNSGELRVQDRQRALRDLLEEKTVEPSLCSKLFKRELFVGLEGKMDPSIKNNEDMLMNYFLFSRAEKAVFEDVCPYHYLIRRGSASRRHLNEHMIFDPIKVRSIILEDCGPELREDARRALARMCLVSYRQIVAENDPKHKNDRKRVREQIRQQLPYVPVLSKRNGMLVRLISYAPCVFELAYGIYSRLSGTERE